MNRIANYIKAILIIFVFSAISFLCISCASNKRTFTVEYLAQEGGTIFGETEQQILKNESATTVTAFPNDGYQFIKWSDGVKTAKRTDKNVKSDLSVTAEFKEKIFTVNYVTDGNGTIEGEAKQTVKFGKNATTVTAVPKEGYQFAKWSDGVKTATRTDENIKSHITVTAEFFKARIFKVNYVTDGNGTIEGEASQKIKSGGNASSVTAVPNEGYRFVKWSDGKTEQTRTDVEIKSNISVEAQFSKHADYVYVLYIKENEGGEIYDLTTGESAFAYEIPYGTDGPKIKAVAKEGFEFVGWNDGVETAERQDLNITEDLDIIALFNFIGHLYTADYKIYSGCGTIQGKAHQEVRSPDALEEVTAVPDAGYVFSCWSDNSLEATRKDDKEKSFEFYAYFEPIQKKFHYDYGLASGVPLVTEITLNRDTVQSAEFIVPKLEGYRFDGWYADEDYKIKVVNENGRYMYGYAGFALESDMLYAKWTKENGNDNLPVYKILMVFVNETDGVFYSYLREQDYEIHFEMTAMDRAMCFVVAGRFQELLNEWFEGRVIFEVDSYYTLIPVGEEGCHMDGETKYKGNWISAEYIPELFRLNPLYHSVLTTYGMDDYSNEDHNGHKFRDFAGIAGTKFGGIPFEVFYIENPVKKNFSEQGFLEGFQFRGDVADMSPDAWSAMNTLDTYFHEFAHTCEFNYNYYEILDFHKVIGYYLNNYHVLFSETMATKYYLLGKAEYYDGETGGIPTEYWSHLRDPVVAYGTRPPDGDRYDGGTIVVLSGEKSEISESRVPYGSDVIVEAVPKEGYRFVRWSDGITTAVRHDENIISYLFVLAIFEKII